MFDFIQKPFKGSTENQTADQSKPKIFQQADSPSTGILETVVDAPSQAEPVAESIPANFDPEQLVSGVANAMLDALSIELEETRVLTEGFFASDKYLQSNALPLLRSQQWEKCAQRCRYAAEAYLAGQDEAVQECWQQALSQARATDSPEWICILLRNALLQRLGTDLRKSVVVDRLFAQLRDQEQAWRQCFIVPSGFNKEKGIRILYGAYGDCDYCIGYDYAYQVFVAFKPDDNYYHWNDYYIYPIDRERAAYFLNSNLSEFPESSDPEAAKRYYANTSNSDIKSRVTR